MAESLEIFDVLQLFEPIKNRFLDEMIHDNAAGAAVFVEGFLEGRVDADRVRNRLVLSAITRDI